MARQVDLNILQDAFHRWSMLSAADQIQSVDIALTQAEEPARRITQYLCGNLDTLIEATADTIPVDERSDFLTRVASFCLQLAAPPDAEEATFQGPEEAELADQSDNNAANSFSPGPEEVSITHDNIIGLQGQCHHQVT